MQVFLALRRVRSDQIAQVGEMLLRSLSRASHLRAELRQLVERLVTMDLDLESQLLCFRIDQ